MDVVSAPGVAPTRAGKPFPVGGWVCPPCREGLGGCVSVKPIYRSGCTRGVGVLGECVSPNWGKCPRHDVEVGALTDKLDSL
jgi:hypothetical protein